MTPTLQKAIEAIQQLPTSEQETFAEWILTELESEQRWQQSFDVSEDLLSQLADEALAEHRAGKTTSETN